MEIYSLWRINIEGPAHISGNNKMSHFHSLFLLLIISGPRLAHSARPCSLSLLVIVYNQTLDFLFIFVGDRELRELVGIWAADDCAIFVDWPSYSDGLVVGVCLLVMYYLCIHRHHFLLGLTASRYFLSKIKTQIGSQPRLYGGSVVIQASRLKFSLCKRRLSYLFRCGVC